MRLAIRDWPPALSHMSCLFIGMFITNLSQKRCDLPVLKENKVLVSFKETFLVKKYKNHYRLGSYVILIKKASDRKDNYCHTTSGLLRLVKNNDFITLETKLSNLKNTIKLSIKKPIYKIIPKKFKDVYPSCKKKAQINYGL